MRRLLYIAVFLAFAGCASSRPGPPPVPPACDYSDVIKALERIEQELSDG